LALAAADIGEPSLGDLVGRAEPAAKRSGKPHSLGCWIGGGASVAPAMSAAFRHRAEVGVF
jgi:hypothetical protein